jgi:hypothetical protein
VIVRQQTGGSSGGRHGVQQGRGQGGKSSKVIRLRLGRGAGLRDELCIYRGSGLPVLNIMEVYGDEGEGPACASAVRGPFRCLTSRLSWRGARIGGDPSGASTWVWTHHPRSPATHARAADHSEKRECGASVCPCIQRRRIASSLRDQFMTEFSFTRDQCRPSGLSSDRGHRGVLSRLHQQGSREPLRPTLPSWRLTFRRSRASGSERRTESKSDAEPRRGSLRSILELAAAVVKALRRADYLCFAATLETLRLSWAVQSSGCGCPNGASRAWADPTSGSRAV